MADKRHLKDQIRDILGQEADDNLVDSVLKQVEALRSESGMDLRSAVAHLVKDFESEQQQGTLEHGLSGNVTELR